METEYNGADKMLKVKHIISGILRRCVGQSQAIEVVLRKLWLKNLFPGLNFGKGSVIGRGTLLRCTDGGTISIGKDVKISDHVCIICRGGSIVIEDGCWLGRGCHIVAFVRVRLGQSSLVAEYVTIRDSDHDVQSFGMHRHIKSVVEPIDIGVGVWIAAKCTIVKGSRIGDNAVIGANSVVRGIIPDYAVAVGIPAKVKRIITVKVSAKVDERKSNRKPI